MSGAAKRSTRSKRQTNRHKPIFSSNPKTTFRAPATGARKNCRLSKTLGQNGLTWAKLADQSPTAQRERSSHNETMPILLEWIRSRRRRKLYASAGHPAVASDSQNATWLSDAAIWNAHASRWQPDQEFPQLPNGTRGGSARRRWRTMARNHHRGSAMEVGARIRRNLRRVQHQPSRAN